MTMKLHALAALACLAACKGKDEKKAEAQSFAQAMEIVCTAHGVPAAENANPAERQQAISEHVKETVTNPEAILVFESVSVAAPAERARILEEAAKKAGLPGCAMIEALDPVRRLAIPELPEAALDPFDEAPLMVVSESVVAVEGRQLELERVESFIGALFDANRYVQEREPDLTIAVAADPETRFQRLFDVVHALVKAGARPVLLVRDGSRVGSIPLAIPDKKPEDPSMPAAAEAPVGMIVAMTTTEMLVWSTSGLEGTLQQPLAKLPHDQLGELEKTLAGIAERRWAGKTRSNDDQQIILMFDAAIPAQKVVAVMAAARKSFPQLLWGRGFE
jgi:biopolymer transport protein ExbD